MGFHTNLAAGLISIGTAFGATAQQCDTSFINARSVAAQLKLVTPDLWNKSFISQLGEQTRADVKKYASVGSHKISPVEEHIFNLIEREQSRVDSGRRPKSVDFTPLMASASPATRKILSDVMAGKISVVEGREQATLATIGLSKQFIFALDAVKPNGCLSPLTVQVAPPSEKDGRRRARTERAPRM